ncbi:unnamed protein product [Thelazia callipaeda]|uniref:RxLR effector protein n=1 Tax=Thelazia callipaeda TaxID=103827 RepID=A0A0N5CWR9_THECL|nr:unnamed protein product [Thelazia callipaeda]
MKLLPVFIIILLSISLTSYALLAVNGNELLLKTHGAVRARRVRDVDDNQPNENYGATRRLLRHEAQMMKKAKSILKNKKYKTIST